MSLHDILGQYFAIPGISVQQHPIQQFWADWAQQAQYSPAYANYLAQQAIADAKAALGRTK